MVSRKGFLFLLFIISIGNLNAQSLYKICETSDNLIVQGNYSEAYQYLHLFRNNKKIKQDSLYSYYLNNFGFASARMGHGETADSLYRLSFLFEKAKPNPNSEFLSTLFENHGDLFRVFGLYDSAMIYTQNAINLRKRSLEFDEFKHAELLHNLGTIYGDMGRPHAAIDTLLVVLSKLEKIKKDSSLQFVNTLAALSNYYGVIGDIDNSLKTGLRAYQLLKTRQDIENNALYPLTTNNLASAYEKNGDLLRALHFYRLTLQLDASISGENHPDYGLSLNNLGVVYQRLGSFDKALPYLNKALNIFKQHYGLNHSRSIIAVGSIANCYLKTNNIDSARVYYLKSLDLRIALLGKNHLATAIGYNNLAFFYGETNKHDSALVYNQKALEIRIKQTGANSVLSASSMLNLAYSFKALGKYDSSLFYYKKVKSIFDSAYSELHPDRLNLYNNIGVLYWAMGNIKQSCVLFDEAVKNQLEFAKDYIPYLPENEALRLTNTILNSGDFYFQLLTKDKELIRKDYAELCYNYLLITKGMLFSNSANLKKYIDKHGSTNLKLLYEKHSTNKNLLSGILQLPSEQIKGKRNLYDSVLAVNHKLEEELIQESGYSKSIISELQVNWLDVRNKLKKDEAAVEILTVGIYNPDSMGYTINKAHYYALVINGPKCKRPILIQIDTTGRLENEFYNYYKNMIDLRRVDKFSYSVFFEPIAKALKGCKVVYFSPSSIYHRINLQSLYIPNNKKHLIDLYDVVLLNSTKEILSESPVINSATRKKRKAVFFSISKFGDENNDIQPSERGVEFSVVDRDIQAGLANLTNVYFAPLPGTVEEVKISTEILKSSNDFLVETYMDDLATEKQLMDVSEPELLHIATHGYFLPSMRDDEKYERMMVNSGLLMARSLDAIKGKLLNETLLESNEKYYDGIATAYELGSLDLIGCKLVVLSACETGLGETYNDGVFGLQRSLRVAGANNVLMTLWKIDDKSTSEFMSYFYSSFVKNNNARLALSFAQKSMRQRGYPERIWASFILVGL